MIKPTFVMASEIVMIIVVGSSVQVSVLARLRRVQCLSTDAS